jgi:hypothetical protein
MLCNGVVQREDCKLKGVSIVLNASWWRKHVAIEVNGHPLRSGLGTINRDDAKLLRPDGLHSWLDDALRSAEHSLSECLRSTSFSLCAFVALCAVFVLCAIFAICGHFSGLRE